MNATLLRFAIMPDTSPRPQPVCEPILYIIDSMPSRLRWPPIISTLASTVPRVEVSVDHSMHARKFSAFDMDVCPTSPRLLMVFLPTTPATTYPMPASAAKFAIAPSPS
jgi:hypothetical protein